MTRKSAELRAWEKANEEYLRTVRALARQKTLRDVGASLAQASAANPMIAQAGIGVGGALLAMLGGWQHRARSEVARTMPNGPARRLLEPGTTLGQHPLETVGEGMMLAAGAGATAGTIKELVAAFRGSAPNYALAFDIAEGGEAQLMAPTGPFSRSPSLR